jgi:heme exporter protein C
LIPSSNPSRETRSVSLPRTSVWLAVVSFGAVIAAQTYAIMTSPPEGDMGHLQKIMYVHVPAAWMTFLAFFVVLVFSVRYLWKRRESDDLLAASAAEVGATFNGLTLMLGMIWGRPAWGVWWVWDARLTSTLVLFLIFVGYLALRAFVDDPDQKARWSAAVGAIGALNVPIVYMSVKWWRTLHQPPSSPATLDPAYTMGLRLNAIALLLVMIYFIRKRYEIARLERSVEHMAEAAAMGGR